MNISRVNLDQLGTIRVMIVDDIQQTRETVVTTLQFQEQIEVVATATNGRQAIEKARETRPDVILMDVNMPDMDGITATKSIVQIVPTAQVVVLTVQDDPDYMRKAMLAGARDFLTKPPTIDDLLGAVQRAGALAREAQLHAPPVPLPSADSSARIILKDYGLGKIITLYSPKGGAGCTLLAANLAVALNSDESQVAIVDGNLQFGDIPVLFNEKSKNSIADLAPRATELDPDIVDEVMITHKKTGIKILASPKPEYADGISGEQFATTLKYLRKLFAYVIVDTSRQLSDVTISALEMSDLVVLLTTQDLPSIASSRKFLDLLPLLKFDSQRLVVAMNQFNRKINIDPQKVGNSFHKEIAGVIPNDARVVIPSINRGVPFMLQSEVRSKPIALSVLNLAEVLRERLLELSQVPEAVPA
jgi:pilus assembly protein CpaE